MHAAARVVFAGVIALAASAGTAYADGCEDIGVVSEDGRYVVLSGDTLVEKDVGSLWWLGIRQVSWSVGGSTLDTAALLVNFADPQTGQLLTPERRSIGVVIHELARSLRTASELVVAGVGAFERAWWLDNGRHDRLVEWDPSAATQKARIRLLDGAAAEVATWTVSDSSVGGFGVGCEDGDGTAIIGGRTRHLRAKDGRAELAATAGADAAFLLSELALGCSAMLVRPPEDREHEIQMARVDLAANHAGTPFTTGRFAAWLMFADGDRLFEQEMRAEEVPGGYRLWPTRQIRTLDSGDGSVLRRAELREAGELSHLFCRGRSERVAVSANQVIYLIDLQTLGVIASRAVPFDRFFVL